MASHGVARTIRAYTEERRVRDLEKIETYRDLENQIRSQVASGNYGLTLFYLTTKLLHLNPEYYTIWNVRRRCLLLGLLSRRSGGSSSLKASLSTSLNATTRPSDSVSLHSSSDAVPPDQRSPRTRKGGAIPITSTATADPPGLDTQDQASDAQNLELDGNVLQSELAFTVPLLLKFPKSYHIWNFRQWTLSQVTLRLPVPITRKIWETELGLVSKMITKDRRNFHAWGYRRFVVAKLERPELQGKSMAEDEFAYTTEMIKFDLSNFSAWHHRSQLMPKLLDERGADDKMRAAFLDKELSIVWEALNVGPEDQSLWFYHSFLISHIVDHRNRQTIAPALTMEERIAYLRCEIDDIKDLLEDYPNIKWIYQGLLECSLALERLGQRVERDSGGASGPKIWLAKLRALDPMRTGRWNDLEREIGGWARY
ncbi:prenyltransferase alpha subunit repeat protein [Hypoxylon sp. FL0890]|nr:prenyltransferase alpha subunit repeat protein [Hypoxylon sp. FL0890]